MNERQRHTNQSQRPPAAGGGPEAQPDNALAELRAAADRLLGIADDAFARIRAEDSREHLFRHRQQGGQ